MSRRHDSSDRHQYWHDDRRSAAEERPPSELDTDREGWFAREGGDPRWGTGGLRAEHPMSLEDPDRSWTRGARQSSSRPPALSMGGPSPWSSRGPYAGIGPRGYVRSDERIREDICERLTAHGQLDPSDIEVTVSQGECDAVGNGVDARAKASRGGHRRPDFRCRRSAQSFARSTSWASRSSLTPCRNGRFRSEGRAYAERYGAALTERLWHAHCLVRGHEARDMRRWKWKLGLVSMRFRQASA